jgi:hypothetical protein
MRVTRAYIAGFGTAGSLLAGLSVLFVMATSLIAYRGWPKFVQNGPGPALVERSSAVPDASKSPDPVVVVADATTPAASRAAVLAATGRRTVAVAHGPTGAAGTLTAGTGQIATQPPPQHGVTPPPAGTSTGTSPCTGASCAGAATGVPGVTAGVTGALGAGVSATGKNLGSTVTAVSGALASKLSAVSPTVGALVSGAGQALGNAVTGVTGTAGNAVTGTGQLLSGVLGGLSGQAH